MSPPFLMSRGHIHDAVVDDDRVIRVDPHRLAGAEQRHLAPIKTNIDLGIFDDLVLAAVGPPKFLYLQIVRLRVRILKCGCKCR